MRIWQCVVCGSVYNEKKGMPEKGIIPGTRFEDIPESWVCGDCGAKKSEFQLVED